MNLGIHIYYAQLDHWKRKFRDLEALPEDEDYSLYKNKRNKEITEDNKK